MDKRYFVAYRKVFTVNTVCPDLVLRQRLFWDLGKIKMFKQGLLIGQNKDLFKSEPLRSFQCAAHQRLADASAPH